MEQLARDLAGSDSATVDGALRRLGGKLGRLEGGDYRRAVELVCSLFYIDTGDRPDLEEALDHATKFLAAEGARVVPHLLRQMEGSDIKSHTYLARTLGRIGPEAIPSLRHLLATAEDPYSRAFALYALGKMICPEVARALPEVLGGIMHPDKEVRDSAARTLGKIAATVPPRRLTPRRRRDMFEALLRSLGDYQPAVRAKAMRSLGKMAAAGLMNRGQKKMFAAAARNALGESQEYSWDNAYIVRREAREALERLGLGPGGERRGEGEA
jgi:HEAT repeat protein